MLTYLLETGQFDVNAVWNRIDDINAIYTTPLHIACEQSQIQLMKCLLKHGADASWPVTNDIALAPLTVLLKTFHRVGDLETLLLMLNNGAVFIKGVHDRAIQQKSVCTKEVQAVQEVFEQVLMMSLDEDIPNGPLGEVVAEQLKPALQQLLETGQFEEKSAPPMTLLAQKGPSA